jgi:hypothetical protein
VADRARIAAKEAGNATAPAPRKRTRAEIIANRAAQVATQIGDIAFTDLAEADRTMLIEAMTALRSALEPALAQALESPKKAASKMKRPVAKV